MKSIAVVLFVALALSCGGRLVHAECQPLPGVGIQRYCGDEPDGRVGICCPLNYTCERVHSCPVGACCAPGVVGPEDAGDELEPVEIDAAVTMWPGGGGGGGGPQPGRQ